MIGIIQCIFAFFACILAWWIPYKIKWEQLYQQLISEYRGYSFGVAIMEIGLFFRNECLNNVDNIQKNYLNHFKNDFDKEKCSPQQSSENILHYQRRLLTQFYYQLDLCAKSIFIGKRRVQRDFSSKESDLLKILFYMNEAALSSKVFVDITCSDGIPLTKKDINSYIRHIYCVLKESPNYIR